MREFHYFCFILRSQPFHNGHLAQVRYGLSIADKGILLLGSYNRSRDIYNPFTCEEREEMIRASLTKEENERIQIAYVRDTLYNYDAWLSSVQGKIQGIVGYENRPKICMVGYKKDASSQYLESFPNYAKRYSLIDNKNLNATDVREAFFTGFPRTIKGEQKDPTKDAAKRLQEILKNDLPSGTTEFLLNFAKKSPQFSRLQEEWFYMDHYLAPYRKLPYAYNFLTGDAVVIQSGHVLLVERGAAPGKGLYALPGGHLGANETVDECIIRELLEETSLEVPLKPLIKSWVATDKFDHPYRSVRKRTITHAGCFLLDDVGSLPKIKAGDDASKVLWMPLSETHDKEDLFYEDHYHIIWTLLARYSRPDDKRHLMSIMTRGR